jgi:hypothetical protein
VVDRYEILFTAEATVTKAPPQPDQAAKPEEKK